MFEIASRSVLYYQSRYGENEFLMRDGDGGATAPG